MGIFGMLIHKIRGVMPPEKGEERIAFRCNICGMQCRVERSVIGRETPSCAGCGSTVRMRSMVHCLSMCLFGQSLMIKDFPHRPDIRGVGMSDWQGYSDLLAKKLGYMNTFYHKEPKLDITSITSDWEGALDFLISTDVFEHIAPPVSIAFENSRRLLRQGGVFVFSAPYLLDPSPMAYEHFPDLHDYRIELSENGPILHNTTISGEVQVFDRLVFHGGEGATLEMRSFTLDSLYNEFQKAGFHEVTVHGESVKEFGIYWNDGWGQPITAKAR